MNYNFRENELFYYIILLEHMWGRDWIYPWKWLMISTIDKNDYVYIYRHRHRSTINIFINTLSFTQRKKKNNQRSIGKHLYHRHCTLYHCILVNIFILCVNVYSIYAIWRNREKRDDYYLLWATLHFESDVMLQLLLLLLYTSTSTLC